MDKLIKNISIKLLIIFFYFAPIITNAENLTSTDFEKLKGYEVKFDYKNYEKEREIVNKYFINKYGSDFLVERNKIGIDLYDIDNDGEKEILVYLNSNGYCGSHGCSFEILKVKSNTTSVLSLTVRKKIKILTHVTSGYHDILFNSQADIYRIWRWNGEEYDLYK
ncbi:MAG: hypothetical protein LN573_02940 [Rickettsia endosymbiont of Oxypoda opaca]|nr:hypothetical protein [Rickettsia endosymbiont of Oxypoda opaca]